jgi:hypothetical protein
MKIDIGESLAFSYLRHVKHCSIIQSNWKPSGNWIAKPEHLRKAIQEFDKIQRHPAFTEIFKTGFDHTVKQTEIDLLGMDQYDTVYATNVTFHEYGINFGAKTDTRNRVIKNLLRAQLALSVYFPDKKHVLMFCSPKVSPATEEIISDYFKILEEDFTSDQTQFIYLSNENFRDAILMETLECIQEEFDTSELFLRAFKLLTLYATEGSEDTSEKESIIETPSVQPDLVPDEVDHPQPVVVNTTEEEEVMTEGETADKNEDERIQNEINKIRNRIPKWFQHPGQNNSKILITYLNLLEKTESVSLEQLAAACSNMSKFSGNFAQMNNIAEKNHGKVFNGTSENIILWEPVKDFIIQQYIDFKKSYYDKQ